MGGWGGWGGVGSVLGTGGEGREGRGGRREEGGGVGGVEAGRGGRAGWVSWVEVEVVVGRGCTADRRVSRPLLWRSLCGGLSSVQSLLYAVSPLCGLSPLRGLLYQKCSPAPHANRTSTSGPPPPSKKKANQRPRTNRSTVHAGACSTVSPECPADVYITVLRSYFKSDNAETMRVAGPSTVLHAPA